MINITMSQKTQFIRQKINKLII